MKIKPLLGLLISILILLYYSSAGANQDLSVNAIHEPAIEYAVENSPPPPTQIKPNRALTPYSSENRNREQSAVTQSRYSTATANVTQTFIGLGITIGLILLVAWGLKKLNNRGYGLGRGMKVVEVLPLGAREKAVLVDVHGKKILVGVAPGTVSGLHVFEDGYIIDEQANHSQQAIGLSAKTSAEFSKKLNAFLGGTRGEL